MKKIISIVAGLTLLTVFVFPVFAKGPSAPAGKSNKAHLYLYEKNLDWGIVEDGAWGKMTYDQSGDMFDYVFNGHGLIPEGDYTLIYYPDPWPGDNLMCFGDGVANEYCDVHIMGSYYTKSDLPTVDDENYYWDISGDWLLDFPGLSLTGKRRFVDLVQYGDGNVSGTLEWLSGELWKYGGILSGSVSGNTVNLQYDRSPLVYNGDFVGTINADGMTGTFTDSNAGTYDWSTTGEPTYIGGAKIWLVQSNDLDCDNETTSMTGWSPAEYLFEYDLINFDYTGSE